MENLVNEDIPKGDPPPPTKEDIIKEKMEVNKRNINKRPHPRYLYVWFLWKIILDQILGDIRKDVTARSHVNNFYKYSTFISQIEPKVIFDALLEKRWLLPMQEELI